MQHSSTRYTFGFAAIVCVVCSILVSGSAVLLRDRQERNKLLDKHKKVLLVAGLIDEGERISTAEVAERFEANIAVKLVRLAAEPDDASAGPFADEGAVPDVERYDPRQAANDPAASHPAPPNDAGVLRIPDYTLVYVVENENQVDQYILPIEGKGLWSTLYGFLALDKDLCTIRGITFYEHGETPGLGGESENPNWTKKWIGRRAFDDGRRPAIHVIKGRADPDPLKDPYRVDGLSGATMTSRGVDNLVTFWLGENGFGPFLERLRRQGG